jgi:hypothetical protein
MSNAVPYVVTIEQVGPNVVVTGSGEFDLTGLTAEGEGYAPLQEGINPSNGYNPSGSLVYLGAELANTLYIGTGTGPANFGSGGNTLASDFRGPLVEFRDAGYIGLFLQDGTAVYGEVTYLPNNLVLLSPSTTSSTTRPSPPSALRPAPTLGRGGPEPIKALRLRSQRRLTGQIRKVATGPPQQTGTKSPQLTS